MKKIFALAAMAICSLTSAQAQSAAEQLDYKPAPYMFIGIQGGAQTTFTGYDQLKLITPTASVSFGAFFTPTVGARLHVNGMWDKQGYRPNFEYNYKYVTTDLDLMLNLFTLFGKETYYPLNVYLIGGIGLNYAWDNDELINSAYNNPFAWEDNRLSHNARIGAMLDYNLAKNWSVNLEVSANSLSDRFNSKYSSKDDWMLTAQIGVAYKFGFKAKPAPAPAPVVVEPEPEPAPAPVVVKEEPKPQPVVKKPEMKTEIFYAIRETTVTASEQSKLDTLIKFLKENTDTKVTVTGYADAGTGNPRINMNYSKQRAENVAKALTDAGIDASRITVDAKGDTVQPFSENDKNRVSIAVAK
ncbi:MAG: OmpA family protein [Bacteroidaceae bacterium]|nr:OmpA family protein [Bacteroidaceae bacterium]